jgi:hypothetical protein
MLAPFSIEGASSKFGAVHSDSSDKRGTQTPLMQMGAKWVQDRASREGLADAIVSRLQTRNKASYRRRAVLVTLESEGGLAHVEALADVHQGKPVAQIHLHVDHGITREWEADAIDSVDAARLKAHELRQAQTKPAEASQQPAARARRRGG